MTTLNMPKKTNTSYKKLKSKRLKKQPLKSKITHGKPKATLLTVRCHFGMNIINF